mgnify:CR=1 FL=1
MGVAAQARATAYIHINAIRRAWDATARMQQRRPATACVAGRLACQAGLRSCLFIFLSSCCRRRPGWPCSHGRTPALRQTGRAHGQAANPASPPRPRQAAECIATASESQWLNIPGSAFSPSLPCSAKPRSHWLCRRGTTAVWDGNSAWQGRTCLCRAASRR